MPSVTMLGCTERTAICSELLRQARKVNLVIVCGRTLSYLNIN